MQVLFGEEVAGKMGRSNTNSNHPPTDVLYQEYLPDKRVVGSIGTLAFGERPYDGPLPTGQHNGMLSCMTRVVFHILMCVVPALGVSMCGVHLFSGSMVFMYVRGCPACDDPLVTVIFTQGGAMCDVSLFR